MIPALSLQNLVFWAAQVALVVGIGLMCPIVFQVRHPRSQLVYLHVLLVLSLAMPFVPFWRNSADSARGISFSEKTAAVVPTLHSLETWFPFVACIVTAGTLLKLSLFVIGLCRIHHYKKTAIPYEFSKDSVLSACTVTHPDLFVGISTNEIGPVTMGWLRPTVLLPASFLSLEEEKQHAILCHELQHVTRNDWITALVEELVGACLWFHPAIWWLLERIKVTREQVIDSEIVRHDYAKDAYIDALLAMAAINPDEAMSPAPMFVHSCHLSERLQLLLDDRPVSRKRITLSYVVMIIIVVFVAGFAITALPLAAHSETRDDAGSADQSISPAELRVYAPGVGTTPRLIERVSPLYPDAARLARVEGTVVLEGVVDTEGNVTVKRIIRHLHPQLDRNAVDAVSKWRFEPLKVNGAASSVTLLIEVSFSLPR